MNSDEHWPPPITPRELREAVNQMFDGVQETIATLGTDLQRDKEGFIIDNSDLGIAVRELEHVTSFLSRLSLRLSNVVGDDER
jgi:hypothetical protein